MTQIDNILKERGNRYGEFGDNAYLSQSFKIVMRARPGYFDLTNVQKSALEMITLKISRIINGDGDYEDNWTDIIGYSELVLKDIRNG